jgi:chromosomal replication initiation ATPase DnaA
MTNTQSIYERENYWPADLPTRGGLARMMAAQAYEVPLEDIAAATRRHPRVALARHVAMYLAHVVFGMTMSEIACEFGRDRTTASHACHRIEDMREDPDLDRLLEWLEAQLRGTRAP